jgi:hypothetical protein
VQVDPIKPALKPPGTKRSKLTYNKLLSSFAFNLNLRRYNPETLRVAEGRESMWLLTAGAYNRSRLNSN